MVKNKRIIISVFFVIIALITSVFIFKKDKNIEQILDSNSYSYLPKEAKNYIKEVYEKTGEVVLTEKNKQEDIPYLNPQYIDYLTMSSKEQESVDLIPDSTIVDYNASAVQGDVTYPATYDLRNLNNKNYITPIKNQGSLGICWAISTIENAETLAMLKSNTPYSNANSINQVFSSRQLDYASSSNGLIDYKINNTTYIFGNEDNSSRKLGESGNFYVSSILLANGLSLFRESDFPWSESSERVYPREVLDYSKSMYEADSTIQMGVINGDSATDSLLQSYISELKGNIINYGGPYVGTYSPESSCGFKNKDGNTVLKTDDCVSANSDKGHAMQIIGWNDNYSYEYCDDGTSHYKAQNGTCTKGKYTTGKGAWLIRNSWGYNTTYLYLTYDSTRITPSFITKLSSMKNRSWDNNYHSNPWTTGKISGGITSTDSVTQDFSTTSYEKEKIEKIKFLNRSSNAEYTLSIESGDKEYNNIATAKVNSVGIYTFDISNKNIIIEDNDFYVTIESTNGKMLGEDSISVFTSNVDKEKFINTYSSEAYDSSEPLSKYNPLYLTGDNYWGTDLTIYPKNFQPNTEFTYRLKRKNSDIVYNNFADIKTSLRNDYSEMILIGTRDAIDGYGSYTMEVLYNNQVIDTFPVKFNDSYSEIKFYANNGTDYYIKKSYKDDEDAVFNDIGSGDSKFYNDGYYITEWNTEPDGSGVSIELDEEFTVFADLDLYAQWSNKKISRTIRYKCNVSSSCAELDKIDKFNYDDEIEFRDNYLTKDGYIFLYWEGPEGNYYEGEKVLVDVFDKYQVYNNKISIYSPKWSNNYKTISFDSNSGTGTMSSIKVEPSVNNRIKYNSFTKEGYEFVGWNTKEDGTGDTYQDGGAINISEDITLYAMWEDERHPIKEVRLNKTVLSLMEGSSELLIATVIPTNTLFDKTITWKSSNEKVATVVNGKVTAIAEGTAAITATTSNGKEATCEVIVKSGWTVINGKTYYYIDGKVYKGFKTIDGKIYYFGRGSGALQKNGWYNYDNKYTYYFDADGVVATGLKEIAGKTYYFESDGKLYKGFKTLDGKLYYFGRGSGALQKSGWYNYDNKYTYYFDKDGVVATGLKEIEGKTYYFESDGKLYKGFKTIDEKLYYFGRGSGALQKNQWYNYDNKYTYYFDKDGVVATGLKEIEGKIYYFESDGKLYKGFKTIDGKIYYFGRGSGALQKNQWYNYDNKYIYYFDKDGVVATGLKEIDGKIYYFESDGKLSKI